jgi:uncharacterized protein involved in response to NO
LSASSPPPAIPPGLVAVNEAMRDAPFWRREPYAVFFPLGIVLSWAGVGRWLTLALSGNNESYLAIYIFHGMTQIQGFLLCFAIGFLFTMIPRRSGTAPPSVLEMTLALAAPVFTVAAAWAEAWALSQLGWLVACALLITFIVRRFASSTARRRPPTSFVWIPTALLMGLAGSLMTGARGALGPEWMWLHDLGQQLVLQGVFLALVLGVGGLALPLMTRGEAPPDAKLERRDVLALAGHVAGALLLVASFVVQTQWSLAAGCALRAFVLAAGLALGPELWRLPSVPGWNRRLVWISAWMLPAGFAIAAIWPAYYQAGIHVSFIGGLATLTLAVSTHVILGHGDRGDLLNGYPWQTGAIAVSMAAAVLSRAAMVVDYGNRNAWMATAAFFFLSATVFWLVLLVPVLVKRRG